LASFSVERFRIWLKAQPLARLNVRNDDAKMLNELRLAAASGC